MKVLVVSHFYVPQREGGAERVARETAQALRDAGHQVHVLALSALDDPVAPDLDAPIPVHRVTYHNTPLPGLGTLEMGAFAKLRWHAKNAVGGVKADAIDAVLEDVAPDVIYAHNCRLFEPGLSRVAARRSIPVVLHLHDYGWVCPRNTMARAEKNCAGACRDCRAFTSVWRRAAQPKAVIAVSAFVRDRHRENGAFPDATWHVLRNACAGVRSTDPARPKKPITRFGFIGAVSPHKGIADVLRAFAELDQPSARLVVAGTGQADFVNAQKHQAKLWGVEDQVTWLGHVAQDVFYDQIDCLVVPSRWNEPQALVLGEAMSHGLPILSSDRGGSTEVVTAAGSGLLYDPDQSGDLLAKMKTLFGADPSPFRGALQGVLPTPAEFNAQICKILETAKEAG